MANVGKMKIAAYHHIMKQKQSKSLLYNINEVEFKTGNTYSGTVFTHMNKFYKELK